MKLLTKIMAAFSGKRQCSGSASSLRRMTSEETELCNSIPLTTWKDCSSLTDVDTSHIDLSGVVNIIDFAREKAKENPTCDAAQKLWAMVKPNKGISTIKE